MQVNKAYNGFSRHFETNFWLYVVTLLCISTGVVLGIYTARYMGGAQKTDLISYFSSFTSTITNAEVNHKYILMETLKSNIPMFLVLWILGLTIVGIPIILIIDIVKGFSLGFTATFIVSGMGVKGVWMTLVGLIPQNVIYIPCLIVASVLGMELSLSKLRDRVNKQTAGLMTIKSVTYSVTFIIILLILGLGFIYEAYITPKAIKIMISSLGSVLS